MNGPIFTDIFCKNYFPKDASHKIPFGEQLNQLFFNPLGDNEDFPVHGPNVVRLARSLIQGNQEPGLLSGNDDEVQQSQITIQQLLAKVRDELKIQKAGDWLKTAEFLKWAAIYHDIGKTIRRPNHPQIGANLLRNFDPSERQALVDALQDTEVTHQLSSGSNRFSRICSIVQHHDKFGVVSTGEGALPIFSDILYFSSDKNSLDGILKNVTQVMLLNLADAAAVNRVQETSKKYLSIRLALRMGEFRKLTSEERLFASFKKELKDDTQATDKVKEFREQYSSEDETVDNLCLFGDFLVIFHWAG